MLPPPRQPGLPIALIAAVARNGAIGAGNRLLWHDPPDQRHFRKLTLGCTVLMGRKTWESLPDRFRPLPGRRNIVLSKNAAWSAPGAERFGSLDAALASLASATPDPDGAATFVIGGAQVYAMALPLADELVLTEIDADLEGDAFFPTWDRSQFEVADCSEPARSASGVAFRFVTYRRRSPAEPARPQSSSPSS